MRRDGSPPAAALRGIIGAALLVAGAAATAAAQLPSASTAALGMADTYTALATGYDALAWSPAGLGLRERSGVALAIGPARGVFGMDPVTTTDLADVGGRFLSRRRKLDWLRRIRAAGGQRGTAAGSFSYAALSIGRFAVQAASRAGARFDLPADAVELLLFGNVGRTGEPRAFELRGATAELRATSSIAVGYAHPLPLRLGPAPDQRFALGAVLKYTVGHALLTGADAGSALAALPLALDLAFPIVHTDPRGGPINGGGLGLDLGAAWRAAGWTVSLALENAVDGFDWWDDRLRYRPGTATVRDTTATTDFAPRPLTGAPPTVRRRIRRLGFGRAIALGLAVRPQRSLRIAVDVRRRGRESPFAPRTLAGLGAEYRPIPSLPLRAGATLLSGGHMFAAGLGIELGRIRLDAAAARRRVELGTATLGMATLSFATR